MSNETKLRIQALVDLLCKIDNEADCIALLEDLCTTKELENMADRCHAATLLLEGKDYVYWCSQSDVKAGRARSIMHQLGTDKMMAVRMMTDGVWRGNVVIDFDNVDIDIEKVKSRLYDVRSNIQYILPEIEE